MTDDEAAYIEAKGWKASVVPEPSIHPPLRELLWIKRRSLEVRHADADFLQNLHLCPLL